jgi:pyrroline-5-carboxylate reductase
MSATVVRLVVVGGGQMGGALASGLLAAGWDPGGLGVAEVDAARRQVLSAELPGIVLMERPGPAAGYVLAVKPEDAEGAARAVADALAALPSVSSGPRPRVLSIMAGIPTERMERWIPGAAVLRAMPNTPARIRCAATALAPGASAGEEDVRWAQEILEPLGVVVRVSEPSLHAVTALSGSGPAYAFLLAEALVEAGVAAGLKRQVAAALATRTLLGAARMLVELDADPAQLRAEVTSPAGVTAAALAVLERRGTRGAVIDAVLAGLERSRALAGEAGG